MGRVIIYSLLIIVTGYLFLGSSEKEALPPPSSPVRQEIADSEKPLPQSLSEETQKLSLELMKPADTSSLQTAEESHLTTTRDRELSLRDAEKLKAGGYADAAKLFHELSEHDPSTFKGAGAHT